VTNEVFRVGASTMLVAVNRFVIEIREIQKEVRLMKKGR
jgi:hypothetical protein